VEFYAGRYPNLEVKLRQNGSTILVSLLVLGLVTMFVATAMSRVTSDSIIIGNDAAESRSYYAAMASLELMTRNFDKVFDSKLRPDTQDLAFVMNAKPSFKGFDSSNSFTQNIVQTANEKLVKVPSNEIYSGLNAFMDSWNVESTARAENGVKVMLSRSFNNYRIPIFQFAGFSNFDMEYYPTPIFSVGGRVHTNGNLFLRAKDGLRFNDRVTAKGEVVVDIMRNGDDVDDDQIYFNNVRMQQGQGSVLNGPDILKNNPDMPDGTVNPNWEGGLKYKNKFGGFILNKAPELVLPISLDKQVNYRELIKRGRGVEDYEVKTLLRSKDDSILTRQRYYNKPSLRITLADTQSRLPEGKGGVRLDGRADGTSANPNPGESRGYQPVAMSDGYQASRLNGHRLYTGDSHTGMKNQTWIKVEIVNLDTNMNPIATDITTDFLSLGLTERVPNLANFKINNLSYYGTNGADSRAIIKMQRYGIPGPQISQTITKIPATTGKDVYTYSSSGYNVVTANNFLLTNEASFTGRRNATVNTQSIDIYPLPIMMFDGREGIYSQSLQANDIKAIYGNTVPLIGIQNIVEIDVKNLRAFINGDWDGKFPGGLKGSHVPNAQGYVLYVSDRRGDADFDGEFDMEDVYGPNNNILDKGEDVNGNGKLDVDYQWEATKYRTGGGWLVADTPDKLVSGTTPVNYATVRADLGALFNNRYFRRAVRLINGSSLPGKKSGTNSPDLDNETIGFTFASENGIYVQGNYNATGVTSHGTPSPVTAYMPYNTIQHVPASIAGDAVTFLSNAWADGRTFRYPFERGQRDATETTYRTGIMTGQAISSMKFQTEPKLNGGMHNMIRLLEDWGVHMNYCGSVIISYISASQNGSFKDGNRDTVYHPPTRNFVFDSSFLSSYRLPPATPMFQYLHVTEFERVNY
jgi:hypothetical protein